MNEAVSGILVERARQTEGLNRMLAVSLFAHAACIALVLVMPRDWLSGRPQTVATPIEISFGGTSGPETPGRAISEQRVQEVAAPDARPADTPPARETPEMTEPERIAKPPRAIAKPVDKSPSRRPTTGAQVTEGDAKAKTGGAHIPFGGLAHQGGGGTDGVRLDVQNFCCPEYLQTMQQRIRQSWNQNQGAAGEVWVKFTIRRDGMLTQVEVEKPSGQVMLDLESRRAVLMTRQLPPLPREFTEPYLTVHVAFNYKR